MQAKAAFFDMPLELLAYPASFLFVMGIFFGVYRYLLARRNQIRAVAKELGWEIQSTLTWNETKIFLSWLPRHEENKDASEGFGTFLPLSIDAEPQKPDLVAQFLGSMPVYSLMRGERDGFEIAVFDFHARAMGERREPISTKILIRSEKLKLPSFLLRPKTLHDKMYSQILGWQDIEFTDDYPIFSQSYVLQGRDAHAIREFFSHLVIAYFEGMHSGSRAVALEGDGASLLFNGGRVPVRKIEAFIESSVAAAKVFVL